jgi:NAD(P)-dependent dehydrogenase (short-subunit alcohol dehydrogenase family)
MNMSQLQGKVAVILGAAARDNMGQRIARRFTAEGARVVVAGRDAAALKVLAAELGGVAATCDITRKADLEALARVAQQSFGKVDIAINCTGHGLLAKLRDTTEAQIDALTSLQFKGVFFFLQVFAEAMAEGGGSIITMSSASVALLQPCRYIGTKAGRMPLVRCFITSTARRGQVNAPPRPDRHPL